MVRRDYSNAALLVKQYCRMIPAYLGIINWGAFKLQINRIQPDDIFIVSFPKSGNTWLRYILACAMKGTSDLSFEELEKIIPDVYLSKHRVNTMKEQRWIKTHDALFDYYPKSVYIYRDYRDVVVSYYHYKFNSGEFQGSLQEFIKSNQAEKEFGKWVDHVKAAFAARNSGIPVLILNYTDVLNNPTAEIEKLLEFCKLKPTVSASEIAQMCSFERLKSVEQNKGSYFGNKAQFFRKGGDTHNIELSKEDEAFLLSDQATRKLMVELNFIQA